MLIQVLVVHIITVIYFADELPNRVFLLLPRTRTEQMFAFIILTYVFGPSAKTSLGPNKSRLDDDETGSCCQFAAEHQGITSIENTGDNSAGSQFDNQIKTLFRMSIHRQNMKADSRTTCTARELSLFRLSKSSVRNSIAILPFYSSTKTTLLATRACQINKKKSGTLPVLRASILRWMMSNKSASSFRETG